ncbi:hypothetical protein [Haloparvum sp. PAK95]|uniref:hypothetical protein n=1 Tax=Haloparvum sp. PAK95 TaxID=3418962 RepID=UPI003D2F36A1
MAGATIEFHFDAPADERRFLREYLPDAWDRFEASDHWETGWFWAYGQFAEFGAGPDGGFLRLVFDGAPDDLVARETDRWAAFDGLNDWRLRRYEEEEEGYDSLLAQQRDAKGEIGGELEYRLKPIVARFALDYYREFDEPVPMVGEEGPENPKGIGFWAAVHDLLVQCGFHWYDETRMCEQALRNRLKSIAAYRGADAAREEYERIRAAWDAHEDELEAWLDANPTGHASEP